ncbi:hypothetical protein DYB34_011547 [Aphanomyces astaci]|uniref:Rubisco LSMT substrate-binding domain-containing protein n=6 Tax=Aphanomyces astaci TaxID=112090 RepID=A0A3R6W5H2_APHAT|nr:hypothetical protein DYB34_011547 [Aphanomyces astaci]
MESPTKRLKTALCLDTQDPALEEALEADVLKDVVVSPLATSSANGDGSDEDDESLDVGERLCRWLEANGAELSKLRIETYAPEVRGVHARDTFVAKERVMRIPLNCLITVEMGKATELGQRLLHLEFGAPKHIYLMMYLLTDMELGNGSFFKCYYDSLPSSLSNMPIFWTAHELAWLQGSHILHLIEDRKAAIERDYRTICNEVPDFGSRFTLDRFAWARMIVCRIPLYYLDLIYSRSRNFGLTIDGVKTAALVPYADMLNHFRPRETWYVDNVEADGRNPNEVWIPLSFLPNESPLLTYLHDSGVHSMDCRFSTCHSDVNTREGLSFLRLIVSSDAEFERMAATAPAHAVPPLSLDNERRALQHLGALATVQLYQYATTLADDTAMLESGAIDTFSNRAQALYFVRGEKQVCAHFQQLAHEAQRVLSLPPHEAASVCRDMYEDADDVMSCYLADVIGYLVPASHNKQDDELVGVHAASTTTANDV